MPLSHRFVERLNLEVRAALQSLARSSRVIGKLFEQMSNQYNAGNVTARWLSRIARGFWALVEVAVPDSFSNIIVRHWLKLLYFFEGLLILGGTLFGNAGIQRFGFVTLAVTLGFDLALLTLSDVMRGRHRWLRIAAAMVVLPLAVALGAGVYVLINESTRSYLWDHIVSRLP